MINLCCTSENQNYNEAISIYSRIHEAIEQEIFIKERYNTYITVEMAQQHYLKEL